MHATLFVLLSLLFCNIHDAKRSFIGISTSNASCASNEIEVTAKRVTSDFAANEYFFIQDLQENVLFISESYPDYSTSTFTLCLPQVYQGIYILIAMNLTSDTTYNYWSTCSSLEIIGPYENRVFKTMTLGDWFAFSLEMQIEPGSWWYWTTDYNPDWFSGPTRGWNYEVISKLPETTATHYFRRSIDGSDLFAAYEFRFLYKYGIVAYLNGTEIYRDNMPDGVITHETKCTHSFLYAEYRGSIRNGFEITYPTEMAVEIHTLDSDSIEFDAWLSGYIDSTSLDFSYNCYPLPVRFAVSYTGADYSHLIDFNDCTSNIEKNIKIDTTYYHYDVGSASANAWFMNTKEYNALRQFKYRSQGLASSTWGDFITSPPYSFDLYGYYVNIKTESGYNAKNYAKYQLYPTVVDSTVYLSDLSPTICYIPYNLTRESLVVVETLSVLVGDIIEIQPDNAELFDCAILPSLPDGVTLDGCQISGIPTVIIPQTLFTIFYADQAGTRATTLSLTVREVPDNPGRWIALIAIIIILLVVLVVLVILYFTKKGKMMKKQPQRPNVSKPTSDLVSNPTPNLVSNPTPNLVSNPTPNLVSNPTEGGQINEVSGSQLSTSSVTEPSAATATAATATATATAPSVPVMLGTTTTTSYSSSPSSGVPVILGSTIVSSSASRVPVTPSLSSIYTSGRSSMTSSMHMPPPPPPTTPPPPPPANISRISTSSKVSPLSQTIKTLPTVPPPPPNSQMRISAMTRSRHPIGHIQNPVNPPRSPTAPPTVPPTVPPPPPVSAVSTVSKAPISFDNIPRMVVLGDGRLVDLNTLSPEERKRVEDELGL